MASRRQMAERVYKAWVSGKSQRQVAAEFGWKSVTMVRINLYRYHRILVAKGGHGIQGYDGRFYREGAPAPTPEQVLEREEIRAVVRDVMLGMKAVGLTGVN